jgi:FAD dependent oxidoreductase TIGR03364
VDRWDVAIVGAGIAGLSLAWHLQRSGKRVVVLDESPIAQGASVRNFGMIWVVGQPPGAMHDLALRSRELWQDASTELGFSFRQSGSLTLAYEELEVSVLQEFLAETSNEFDRKFLSREEILAKFPFVNPEGLKGGLMSPTEGAVDPREVVHGAAKRLSEKGVDVYFDCPVAAVRPGIVESASGDEFHAENIVVCPGPKLFDLYPQEFVDSGLRQTRLQMLRLKPVAKGAKRIGIHLCAGLTLGHYANFQNCPSLPALQELHSKKWQKQVEHGVHVLVAENPDGTLTVGDSHHYGRDLAPYRDEQADEAILQAMDEFLPLANYQVVQRWEGTYNTHAELPYWWKSVGDGIWALNLFGTGMTLSFGITEQLTKELY